MADTRGGDSGERTIRGDWPGEMGGANAMTASESFWRKPYSRKEKVIDGLLWAMIAAAIAWWQFGPGSEPEPVSKADVSTPPTTVARPPLTEQQRYNMMMVDPDRARAIREAKDHKTLVLFMREIEKASATALQVADAKEFKIQEKYSDLALMRSGQIPDPNGKATDCLTAVGALNDYLGTVVRSFSPARAEAALTEVSGRWRKSMAACERAVGLKPSSRVL